MKICRFTWPQTNGKIQLQLKNTSWYLRHELQEPPYNNLSPWPVSSPRVTLSTKYPKSVPERGTLLYVYTYGLLISSIHAVVDIKQGLRLIITATSDRGPPRYSAGSRVVWENSNQAFWRSTRSRSNKTWKSVAFLTCTAKFKEAHILIDLWTSWAQQYIVAAWDV